MIAETCLLHNYTTLQTSQWDQGYNIAATARRLSPEQHLTDCCMLPLLHVIPNSMEHSPSWKANSSSASQLIHKCSPYPEPEQPLSCLPILLKIHFNIILPFMPGSSNWSVSISSPHQKLYAPLLSPHSCHMPNPSHSSWFDHPYNIWWGVQTIRFLVM